MARIETPRAVAFLFDSQPASWTSREDQHLAVSRALLCRGIQPIIFLSRATDGLRSTYESAGVVVIDANYRDGARQYFLRMREVFRQYRVDTVDIEFFCYFDPIAWMARALGVRRIVFTESNSGLLRSKSWKLRLLRLRAVFWTLPVRRFVAISDFVGRQMAALGMSDSRIAVIHKGLDLGRYGADRGARARLEEAYGVAPDEIVLGTITMLRAFKHPEVILHACALLQARQVPFRLFIAGEGELKPELMALAERLGIGRRVIWLGYVERPEDVLRGWDAFLLASEGEAFGFVLLEAMASGLPVVAARSGAIPEVVADGVTGLLTPVLDATAMAAAIEKLARDECLRLRLGSAGAARVRDFFSIGGAVEKTLRVYDSLPADL